MGKGALVCCILVCAGLLLFWSAVTVGCGDLLLLFVLVGISGLVFIVSC